MTDLTVVASLLATDLDPGMTSVELETRLPEIPITRESFMPIAHRFTPDQIEQVHSGVAQLQRVFSRRLVTHLTIRRISRLTLNQQYVMSDTARARIENGAVDIALATPSGFQGSGIVGRPQTSDDDDALKGAFAQSIARLQRLGGVSDRDQYPIYEDHYARVGDKLQAYEGLFNLSKDHKQHHHRPVLNWCKEHASARIATAYGVDEITVERSLDAAYRARLGRHGFDTALAYELALFDTICLWVETRDQKRAGQASRRDTIRRMLAEQEKDWQSAPGDIAPPTVSTKVRRNLVAQDVIAVLTPQAMLAAAVYFDLEPAYHQFWSRLYLLPLLEVARLAGQVGLRRQYAEITSPITAGGLIALAEHRNTMPRPAVKGPDDDDEIGEHLDWLTNVIEWSGMSIGALSDAAHDFLRTSQPVQIVPPQAARHFFVFD